MQSQHHGLKNLALWPEKGNETFNIIHTFELCYESFFISKFGHKRGRWHIYNIRTVEGVTACFAGNKVVNTAISPALLTFVL